MFDGLPPRPGTGVSDLGGARGPLDAARERGIVDAPNEPPIPRISCSNVYASDNLDGPAVSWSGE